MTGSPNQCELALVLASADKVRAAGCRAFAREGYDVIGFADCEHAAAWLDEETPAVAIVDMRASACGAALLEILHERGVRLVRIP